MTGRQCGAIVRERGPVHHYDGSINPHTPREALVYSTDPTLSIQRRQDPDYTDSSDQPMLYSSSTVEYEAFPSSPPRAECVTTRFTPGNDNLMVDDATDEDLTDEDDENMEVGRENTLRSRVSSVVFRPARSESTLRNAAEFVMRQVFDNEANVINLESQGFDCVPKTFEALINHEDLGHKLFHINLSINKINKLDRFVYDIVRIKFLNLRHNQLSEISPLMSQWQNLEELHLAHNNLTTLPRELLYLPALTTLTTYPNDFLEPTKPGQTELLSCDFHPPTLTELAQRSICSLAHLQQIDEFKRVLNPWVSQAPKLIEQILDTIDRGRVCSICSGPLVTPFATHLVWTRHPADRSGGFLPYRTTICSRRCLDSFRQ